MTVHQPEDWLKFSLEPAIRGQWCLQRGCTTCGCPEMRPLLLRAGRKRGNADKLGARSRPYIQVIAMLGPIHPSVSECSRSYALIGAIASFSQVDLRSPDLAMVSASKDKGRSPPRVWALFCACAASEPAASKDWAPMAAGACVLSWMLSVASFNGSVAFDGKPPKHHARQRRKRATDCW